MRVGVIIVAAGSGTRMGGNIPKQFLKLDGRTILVRTLEKFYDALPSSKIVVVLSSDMQGMWADILREENCSVPHSVCIGGSERFFSVKSALSELRDVDYIAVHDAVRPLLSQKMITQSLALAQRYGAVVPVINAVDSYRELVGEENVALRRDNLRIVQTPQIFRSELIIKAYDVDFSQEFTDDASVVEKLGQKIYLCQGELRNIKITNPLDLKIAQLILTEDEF